MAWKWVFSLFFNKQDVLKDFMEWTVAIHVLVMQKPHVIMWQEVVFVRLAGLERNAIKVRIRAYGGVGKDTSEPHSSTKARDIFAHHFLFLHTDWTFAANCCVSVAKMHFFCSRDTVASICAERSSAKLFEVDPELNQNWTIGHIIKTFGVHVQSFVRKFLSLLLVNISFL